VHRRDLSCRNPAAIICKDSLGPSLVSPKIGRLTNTKNSSLLIVVAVIGAETEEDNDDTHLIAIFQDNSDKPVPECLDSGFYWS